MPKRTKKKVVLYIFSDQFAALKKLAEKTMDEPNVSHLVRQALDAFLRR